MLRVLLRRLATGAATLLIVTSLVFLLVHLAPGDPADAGGEVGVSGTRRLTPEREAQFRALYRLDEPLHRRYALWLSDLARLDLGRSLHDRRPVASKIGERLGTTLLLNGASLALMIALAFPIGAAAALRPGSLFDRFAAGAGYALYAVPVFWAGLLLQLLFAARLGWLPLYGIASDGAASMGLLGRAADRAIHLVLPVVCLTYGGLAYLSRFVRATLLESARGDASRAALARGRSVPAALLIHGVRQAGVPMLTLAGFLVPRLVGGSVLVETIFAVPGLGRLFVESAFRQDLPVVLGLTLLSGSATLAGILAADLAYAWADPRVRRG